MGIDWEEYYGVAGQDDDALQRATEADYFAEYDNDKNPLILTDDETKKHGLQDTYKTKEEWRRDFLEKKLTPIGFELENKYSLDGACEIAKALHTFNDAVEALDKAGNTELADKLLYFLRQASKDRVSLKTSTECACPIPF